MRVGSDLGFKAISEVVVGEIVHCYDVEKEQIDNCQVENISQRTVSEYYILNNIIKVTAEHPFYSQREWIKTEDLEVGMKLFNGIDDILLTSIDKIYKEVEVYNLSIDKNNNFFVEGILVHNIHDTDQPTGCYVTDTNTSCNNNTGSCNASCNSVPEWFCCNCNLSCEGNVTTSCSDYNNQTSCEGRDCTWNPTGEKYSAKFDEKILIDDDVQITGSLDALNIIGTGLNISGLSIINNLNISTNLYVGGNLAVICPGGFTSIERGGNQLGCMQNNEADYDGDGVINENDDLVNWEDASDYCFDNYGGRLSTTGEWYISMVNYVLNNETDDWEWNDDFTDDNKHSVSGNGAITTQYDAGDYGNYSIRCWIPR